MYMTGRRLQEFAMKDDNEKHGLIGNFGNRGNKFITTAEQYFNEIINFNKQFVTMIAIYKTILLYNITILSLMSYFNVNPKEKYTAPYCGIVSG